MVKLKHASSEYDLHSHEISYGSGSGQQSVTGYKDTSDAASLWAVKGAKVGLHVFITLTAPLHSLLLCRLQCIGDCFTHMQAHSFLLTSAWTGL